MTGRNDRSSRHHTVTRRRQLAACAGLPLALLLPDALVAHEAHKGFAAGEPGAAGGPARAVTIRMAEAPGKMSFSPDRLVMKKGEQVRFIIVNEGKSRHEFMLDTAAHNAAHDAMMRMHPAMEHDDPNGKTLAPGQTATILWHFSKAGTYEFACLIPGHYEAGMHGTVVVQR